jgi:predicted dehydrogenase
MIRLAFIGCRMGRAADRLAVNRLRNASVTAVADSDVERARSGKESLGSEIATGSLDELLGQHADAFDAVIIDSPDRYSADQAVAAAQAGKHVLVEMPLALSSNEADKVIAACHSAGVCLMVGQATRFLPSHQVIKTSLDTRKLGEPGLVRIHRWETVEIASTENDESTKDGDAPSLIRRIVRDVDLAGWLFASRPTNVYAASRNSLLANSREDDYVQIHLGYPEGGMALIDFSASLPTGSDYYSLSVIGSSGAAYADDHHNTHLLFRGGAPSALNAGQDEQCFSTQVQEFVDAVTEEREPAITGTEGRTAMQVCEAVIESLNSQQALRLAGEGYERA